MVEKGKREKGEGRRLKKRSREDIFSYFATEILRRADPETRDFLMKISLFSKMTTKMAEELTGLSSAGRILSGLNRDNFFTEKRIQEEPVYQFHPLFREFLLERTRGAFSVEAEAQLKSKAARILEEAEQFEAAVALLKEMKDWDEILRLIAKRAVAMLSQGRHLLLREWLQAVPEDLLSNNPWHLFWMGATYFGLTPSAAIPYFEKALEKFRTQENIPGLVHSLSSLVFSIFHEAANFKLIDPLLPPF